jgi:shikimate dehydrogenase
VTAPRVWLGVAGWPVAHSRSPQMHNAALAAAGLGDWRYARLPLPPELFAETVRALPARGFRGLNVTIPHKEAALGVATAATDAARAIGAANTLTFERGGAIFADNTDAPGLLEAVRRRLDPAGRTALVLGSGGAARAAVYALVGAGAEVLVWNRTPERAEKLADELGARAVRRAVAADLVVNCTSVGLGGDREEFKTLPVRADTVAAGSCVVDMVYRDGGTPFLNAAKRWGAETVDGLEILIAQGAASFERWTGRPPDLRAMGRAAAESAKP